MAVGNLNSGVGIQPTIIDAKGDLLVGTADNVVNRLGVTGTTGSVLTADAGETTGLKWAAAGSVGGLVHINETTFSAVASQTVNSVFDSNYSNYLITYDTLVGSFGPRLEMRFTDSSDNVITSSSYGYATGYISSAFNADGNATNQSAIRLTLAQLSFTGAIQIFNPFSSTIPTRLTNFSTGDNSLLQIGMGAQMSAAQNNGFQFFVGSSNITGTIRVYGYKN